MDPETRSANTSAAVSSTTTPRTVERFVRCPVGLDNRLITSMGRFAATDKRHFPLPVPSAPLSPRPCPDSSSRASSVRERPPGSVNSTPSPGDAPASSTASMRTRAFADPGFTTRNRLTWFRLPPGLTMNTSCASPREGATSCTAVKNPSSVRM